MQANSNRCGQARRRSLFDHFLIAALYGAITFAKCDHFARAVAEYLYLDVTGVLDIALQEHAAAGKMPAREALHGLERGRKPRFVPHQLHADPAAARGALEHNGITNAGRLPCGVLDAG